MALYENFVMLKGRLGDDVKLIDGKNGQFARFSLAVYRSGKGEKITTDWFNCIANRGTALGVANINKGTMVIVIGSIVNNIYEKGGIKRYEDQIDVREIGLDVALRAGKGEAGQTEELSEDSPF